MDTSRDDPCPLGADVVECVDDDGTRICRFKKLATSQAFFYFNDRLQKL